MKKIFKDNDMLIPVKLWLDDVEPKALNQIINLSKLPFAFHHVAIMPDCHMGYGMPIGGVLATKKVVIPNAVGVDIGCGMCAVKTSLKVEDLDTETLKKIMGKIREVIPVGIGKKGSHKEKQNQVLMPYRPPTYNSSVPIVSDQYQSALKQLGTLGSGNHFIEIQKDTENNIWIMIHSGSRNLGYKVAEYYNKIAIELNEKWCSSIPKKWELAFLHLDSKEGQDYLKEMNYCVDFAFANRKLMMDRIIQIFMNLGLYDNNYKGLQDTKDSLINIAHNNALWENHFGQNIIVHRKGATLAREGTIGIIPGSQGSNSYIVKGLGNPESFNSCSHGAGRKMGRNEAKKKLNLVDEQKKLKGIIHSVRNINDLDEATGAYKDIKNVMANQSDLVSILVKLTPLGVIKG